MVLIKLPIPVNTELFADSPNLLVLGYLCPCSSPRLEFFPHRPSISTHLNHTHYYQPISDVIFLSKGSPLCLMHSTGASQQ